MVSQYELSFLASISALLKAVRNLGLTWVKEKERVKKNMKNDISSDNQFLWSYTVMYYK